MEDAEQDIFEDLPSNREAGEAEELPPLMVWVNAGFGSGSYPCRINSDSTMTIPDPLVRELGLQPGDDVDMEFDEEDGTLYLAKKERGSEPDPEWLQD